MISDGVKVWSVYVMAAPAGNGVTYFKVGRTSNVLKRIGGVQTGCPLRIQKVWAITLWSGGASQGLESRMHDMLRPFHTHGEWFAMRTDDPEHKRAMNEAFAAAVRYASQASEVRWREMDVAEIREAVSALGAEVREKGQRIRKRESARALALMATTGRRVL